MSTAGKTSSSEMAGGQKSALPSCELGRAQLLTGWKEACQRHCLGEVGGSQPHLVATASAAAPAAVAALAATTTAAVAAATAAAATILARSRFIDGQRPSVEVLAVQGGDGRLRLLVVVHFDKAEPLGAAGVPVHDDLGGLDRAVRCEEVLEIAVGSAIRQVADIQLLAHFGPPTEKTMQGQGPQRTQSHMLTLSNCLFAMGQEKCKVRDDVLVITAMTFLQGPRTPSLYSNATQFARCGRP